MAIDTAQKRASIFGHGTRRGIPGWPGSGVDAADRAQLAGVYAGFDYTPVPVIDADYAMPVTPRSVIAMAVATVGTLTIPVVPRATLTIEVSP